MKVLSTLLLLLACGPALAGPKLYVFDCGALYFDEKTLASFSLKPEETPVRELFVPCYLVEHAKGRLLWDAGLPIKVAGSKGERVVVDGFPMSYKRSIVEQLADINLAPADIGLAAYSHLHFDHVGAADAFPKTTVLMQKAEWDFATGEGRKFANAELLAAIEKQPRKIIEGDLDVFGDGSVRIVSAPGHTPGHQVLLIRLEKTGPVVLSGDLYHFKESRAMRRVPTFNFNAEETLRSMDKIEALVKETGAQFWIEHEKANADTLRKAPQFYE